LISVLLYIGLHQVFNLKSKTVVYQRLSVLATLLFNSALSIKEGFDIRSSKTYVSYQLTMCDLKHFSIESRISWIESQIESRCFKSNLYCSNQISCMPFHHDLNRISVGICPSLG